MKVRLRVPAVDDPDFVADFDHGEVAVLRFVGSADNNATAPLASLLSTLHDELRERNTREIVVDLRGLDFMSAPCFSQLVTWLTRLQELAAHQRYRIRFRLNASINWQSHSLAALRPCLGFHGSQSRPSASRSASSSPK